MDTTIKPIKTQNYNCEKCKFITKHKNDYNKHLLTRKHNKDTPIIHCIQNTKKQNFKCQCGKEYKYSQGLFKQKQKCNNPNKEPIQELEKNLILGGEAATLHKTLKTIIF